MHFTSETSSNGVIERNFILDEIPGVLWSPTSGTVGSPLLLAGHSGGMHKKAPGLLASAFLTPANWNRVIAPGGSATGGLRGVLTGSYSPPANCVLNRQYLCT